MNKPSQPTHSTAPIAILGGGPAGCAMAILLAQSGRRCLIIEDGNVPEMIVGESLIPAVVPVLKRLGVTEAIDKVCNRKPGVTFLHDELAPINFRFRNNRNGVPNYAWNAPRPAFDDILRNRAIELGVPFIRHRAELLKGTDGEPELLLDTPTLKAAGLTGQPAFIIDATGRVRLASKALSLSATRGPRTDVSHFAHYIGGARPDPEGVVVIARLSKGGWAWVIPLPDRVSIGIVVSKNMAKDLGTTPEQRLQNVLDSEPTLKKYATGAKKISTTATYSNYQLTSERGHGHGWASIGDAYGFVDPMLSSGLFMALESARSLFDASFAKSMAPSELPRWSRALDGHYLAMQKWLASWQELINYFYSGELFRLCLAGGDATENYNHLISRFMERETNRRIAGMASGASTCSSFDRQFLRFVIKHFSKSARPAKELEIR